MIEVAKGTQPAALTAWQATPGADWGSMRSEDLWEALLAEQGHVCAYCQRVIPVTPVVGKGMHVEHWLPRASGGGAFEWTNLLGVCPGDETAETGALRGERHCDTSKADTHLFLHPVVGKGPSPVAHLAYTTEGEAVPIGESTAVVAKVAEDIETLKLSADRLMRGRVDVYETLKDWLDRKGWTEANLRRLYREYAHQPGAHRPAYAEVARYYLRRWARRKNFTL